MDNTLLTKLAQFVKLAVSETERLQTDILELKKKEAAEEIGKHKYELELKRAADALYDADFLTDDHEKKVFLRKAAEDPVYVIRILEKVCEAADIAQIGKPARVAAKPKEAEYDPVMARAFGRNFESVVDE